MSESAFRDAVLAGAGRIPQDAPGIRAAAAVEHFKGLLVSAEAAEDSANAAVAKAQAQVLAGQEAVVAAQAQRERAVEQLAASQRLHDDVRAGKDISGHLGGGPGAPGENVTIQAGIALGEGSA